MKLSVLIVLPFLLWTSGCTRTYLQKFDSQSHYVYPNSNVIPLSHVKGEASESAFFVEPMLSAALQHSATYKALESTNADLLVNSFHFVDRTDFGPIHTITYRIEGTAAKMEAGITRQH